MPVWLIHLLIGIVLSVAGQIATSMARQDSATRQRPAGVRTTLQFGGDLPPRFVVGRSAWGGQLRYAGTWGAEGETPNAYFSRAIEVSCLPVRGYSGWYVNGERVTLAGAATGDLGFAVLEYRVGGKDHMWINPYLGDQTAPDPLMLAKFGDDPDRPYTGMVGRGCGYFVVSALVNRELFPGVPEVLAEVDGIDLDDPRGDNQHDNPIVAAYTLLKGLVYSGEWIWGPQGIGDVNFRAANLEAEADKCDADRELAAGGTEKRFRIGMDIGLDEEPQAIVGELLKGCSGRWADLGGVYRFLVGAPGAAAVAFTDEDVIVTEPQTLDPFPGLENLHNAMTATYPEPAEAWAMKEAPPRYSTTLETADDGRRLPFSTAFRAVPHAVQVQELMQTAVADLRRFRRHSQTMPPEWWEYEPLDVAAWTSSRNGYEGKDFLVTVIDDLPNANQFIGLQEIDPADYGWSEADELPVVTTPLVVTRPAPQPMTGWTAAPYVYLDNDGGSRRPGIEVGYAGTLVDVRAVRVQVRLDGAAALVFDGEVTYDPAEAAPSRTIYGNFMLPATDYEVRGRFLPFSGRETEWSAWLAVTTPNVGIGIIDLTAALARDVREQQGRLRDLIEQFRQVGTLLEAVDRENFQLRNSLVRDISVQLGDLSASFTEVIEVALGPGGAIATALASLYAAMGGNDAAVNIRWTAVAAPSGYAARYAVTAEVNDGQQRSATFFIDVPTNPAEPTRIGFMAGQTVFFTSGGDPIALIDENGFLKSANGVYSLNLFTGAESITVTP